MCQSGVPGVPIPPIYHPCRLSLPLLAPRPIVGGSTGGNTSLKYQQVMQWWVRTVWWWLVGLMLLVVSSTEALGGGGIYSHYSNAVPGSRLIVTRKGSLRGLVLTLEDRQAATVEMYLGIPYASPPVGNLRFMPPVTSAPWRGVRHVDHFGPVCPQQFPDISNETAALRKMPRGRYEALKRLEEPLLRNQSEDCLFLNIYVPVAAGSPLSTSSRERLPVIVYIHGESYAWGSGNLYDGSVLAAMGRVIVVTLNYRLGILGFLNPNTDPYSRSIANHGLMDQIAALHWLQENVAEFGGDPTSITIMGHGTGAACITLLMTSPAVPDGMLFHRAIVLSGSALSPWALIQDPTRYATALAHQLNCSTTDLQTYLVKCLRDKPLSALMGVKVDTPDFLYSFGPSVDGVVIDNEWEAVGPYGSSTPPSKKFSDRLARYELLMGVSQAESYFAFTAEDNQYGIEVERRNRLLRTYVRNTYQYHLQEILATIVNEYTDWEKPVLHPITIRDETLEALSDAQYIAPMVKMADLHSTLRPSASYFYVFEYQTKASDYPQRLGCVHGEELAYVFGAPLVPSLGHFTRNYTKAEAALAEMVINYWTNFARTGNPNDVTTAETIMGRNPERNSKSKHLEWPAYERQHRRFISLGTKPKAKSHYRSHRLALWLSLIPDLHRPTGTEVPRLHHLLDDYDDPASYDGKVRPGPPATRSTSSSSIPWGTTPPASRALWPVSVASMTSLSPPAIRRSETPDDPSDPAFTDPRAADVTVRGSSTNVSSLEHQEQQQNSGGKAAESFGAYSTALSVTIAIGCSLLILNVLIFAGVYYQRDKQRLEAKRRLHNGMTPMNISGELEERESLEHHQHLTRYSNKAHNLGQALEETGRLNCTLPSSQPSPSTDLAPLSPASIGSAGLTPQLPPPEFADLPTPGSHHHHHHHHQVQPPNGSITTLYGGGGGNTLPRGGVKTTLTSSVTLPRRYCSVGVQNTNTSGAGTANTLTGSTGRRSPPQAILLELQAPKASALKRSPSTGASSAPGQNSELRV